MRLSSLPRRGIFSILIVYANCLTAVVAPMRAEAALRLSSSSSAATSPTPFTTLDFFEFSLGANQYANESKPTPRFDLQLKWNSPNRLHQIGLTSFVEFGAGGNMTFDPDPVVFRVPIGTARVFFGRTNPMFEGATKVVPTARDAIGAVWAQNQLDPLSPRATGWIGMGASIPLLSKNRLSLVAQYSPIFLPHFTPSLGIDEEGRVNASRFARLPPAWVNYDAGQIPIRLKIDTGPILQIIRQDQAFVGLDHASPNIEASVSVWTAPRPDPKIASSGKLLVNGGNSMAPDLAAMVTAYPSFPRQNFLGTRFRLSRVFGSPEFQSAFLFGQGQPMSQQGGVISASWTPLRSLRLGFLDAIGTLRATDADYTDRLVWAEYLYDINRSWVSSARIDQHVLTSRTGSYFSAMLGYSPPATDWQIQARAGFLAGENAAYYGAWRNMDSVWLGAKSVW